MLEPVGFDKYCLSSINDKKLILRHLFNFSVSL